MALLARNLCTGGDSLAESLIAAELGEPHETAQLDEGALRELFTSIGELHQSIPFAALKLFARLAADPRAEVRARTARALGWFVDLYAKWVEELLLLLACDSSRKVRNAAAESLADLIPAANDPWALIETWNAHPDRAREVLQAARRSLPPPLGV
jgi:hypothetical protein